MDTGKNRKKEEKSKFNGGYFASVLVSLKLDSFLHTTTFPEAQTKIVQQWPGILTRIAADLHIGHDSKLGTYKAGAVKAVVIFSVQNNFEKSYVAKCHFLHAINLPSGQSIVRGITKGTNSHISFSADKKCLPAPMKKVIGEPRGPTL